MLLGEDEEAQPAIALRGRLSLPGLALPVLGGLTALTLAACSDGADELDKKLLARIRSVDCGARDVDVMVVTWPVNSLPS